MCFLFTNSPRMKAWRELPHPKPNVYEANEYKPPLNLQPSVLKSPHTPEPLNKNREAAMKPSCGMRMKLADWEAEWGSGRSCPRRQEKAAKGLGLMN